MSEEQSLVPVVLPELGLPADCRIVVTSWLASTGDAVVEGDRLVELLNEEITFDLACPATGRLASIRAPLDRRVAVGSVLAWIQPEDDA